MDKVVILGRVSTDQQDYQRQVYELQDYCDKVGWEVVGIFTNKVSGTKSIEERKELQEMIQFIKENKITRVVCLEVSRLGRNTLESLKVIQILNENKVSLFIKNYNLETETERVFRSELRAVFRTSFGGDLVYCCIVHVRGRAVWG